MPNDDALRKELIELFKGGHAHATFDKSVEGFPPELMGTRPASLPHSGWELLEHMRITLNDILEFSLSADYVSPDWPSGYWPKEPVPAKPEDWNKSVEQFHADRKRFEALLVDPAQDLHRPFPWGEGQTLLREALVIATHTSYHLGQMLLVRKALGAWPAA